MFYRFLVIISTGDIWTSVKVFGENDQAKHFVELAAKDFPALDTEPDEIALFWHQYGVISYCDNPGEAITQVIYI